MGQHSGAVEVPHGEQGCGGGGGGAIDAIGNDPGAGVDLDDAHGFRGNRQLGLIRGCPAVMRAVYVRLIDDGVCDLVIRRRRLVGIHIKTGAEALLPDRPGEGGLIDDAPPTGVDERGPILHGLAE